VSRRPRRGAGRDAENDPLPPEKTTRDRPLADQIMQQLTRRDQTDDVSTQRLLRHITIARSVSSGEDGGEIEDGYTVARQLYETARLWRDCYERGLRDQLPNLTSARCTVLLYLAQHEGANQSALAQFLDIRPSTLVRLLDRLEAGGFVTRMPDLHDRRAHVVALAEKARPIVASIYGLVEKSYGDRQLGLSGVEISQLRALLYRMQSTFADRRTVVT
jgi:MarR family transcriptional regulator for hemolysin